MGLVERIADGSRVALRPRHLVGRSSACDLVWDDARVSGEHATFLWTGEGWAVRDLASRNGTWAHGTRIAPGAEVGLQVGQLAHFGGESAAVRLVDGAPPGPFAVRSDGTLVPGVGDLLSLGESVSLYRDAAGDWLVDRLGDLTAARDRAAVEVDGATFVVHLPDVTAGTVEASAVTIDRLALRFVVSADEERVSASGRVGERTFDLRRRNHHYVLLTLARERRRDAEGGVAAVDAGWVYFDELVRMLRSNENRVNVEIFRAREQLAAMGVVDAARLVERRPETRQLRLGCAAVEIDRES